MTLTPQPLDAALTDDVKKFTQDFIDGDLTTVRRAIDAGITINIGVCLQVYYAPEALEQWMDAVYEETKKINDERLKEWQKEQKRKENLKRMGIVLPGDG